MQNQVVLINDALREASKFLHRDYFELENLQNSARSIKVFVDKAKKTPTKTLSPIPRIVKEAVIFISPFLIRENNMTQRILKTCCFNWESLN